MEVAGQQEQLFQPQDIAEQTYATLRQVGRVHIPGILGESYARSLLTALEQAKWRTLVQAHDYYDLTPSDIDPYPERVEEVRALAYGEAGPLFRFMFDSVKVSEQYESGRVTTGPLADFYRALNSKPALEYLRSITGEPRIAYVDAQATRYRPGQFLGRHDDQVPNRDRLFAYVLNLTPTWYADWGGLLMFMDADGHVSQAFTPAWNALNILAVPQPHAVSLVAPFATQFRYSITGWMRSRLPR